MLYKRIAVAIALSTPLFAMNFGRIPEAQKAISLETEIVASVEEEEEPTYQWTGPGLTENEQLALNYFQDLGITDRSALAVLLGNIKQESKFHSNICEGGARVEYHSCHRGGYGLIQWTTLGRYRGLGRHASSTGGDPSSFMTQLTYIPTEVEWKKVEHKFKTKGQTIGYYMNAAYSWLGWGVHGARSHYSYQYYDFLVDSK